MCKNYCLITPEEKFHVGQTLIEGRIGIHPSVELIYKKISQSGMSSINKYKLMEIDVEESKLKKGNTSLLLKPNSKAKVIAIRNMS